MLEKEELYHNGCHVVKQGPQSPEGNQAGIKKLSIGTITQVQIMELQHKYMGLASP